MEQQQSYYQSLSDNRRANLAGEEERNESLLKALTGIEEQFKMQQQLETGGSIQTKPVPPGDSPSR